MVFQLAPEDMDHVMLAVGSKKTLLKMHKEYEDLVYCLPQRYCGLSLLTLSAAQLLPAAEARLQDGPQRCSVCPARVC